MGKSFEKCHRSMAKLLHFYQRILRGRDEKARKEKSGSHVLLHFGEPVVA